MRANYKRTFCISICCLLLTLIACSQPQEKAKAKLTLTPANASVKIAGAAITFIATLENSDNEITWNLVGPGKLSGTKGKTVQYTPPTKGGAGTAILKASAGESLSKQATIVIQAQPSLTITPANATVSIAGAAITFNATLANSNNEITWNLVGPGKLSGTKGKTVQYTPPTKGGAGTAILKASAGESLSKQATIVIQAQPSLTITPANATVSIAGAAITFNATLANSNNEITWNLVGPGKLSGTKGKTVQYTPPTTGSAGTATLNASAGTNLGKQVTITIQAQPNLSITSSKREVTIGADNKVTLKAELKNSSLSPTDITWSLSPSIGKLEPLTGAETTYILPDTLASIANVTISAKAGGLSASTNLIVNPLVTTTISGRVIDNIGKAVADAKVKVDSLVTATDSAGNFSLSGVNANKPYDVTIITGRTQSLPIIHRFEGLTKESTTLQLSFSSYGGPLSKIKGEIYHQGMSSEDHIAMVLASPTRDVLMSASSTHTVGDKLNYEIEYVDLSRKNSASPVTLHVLHLLNGSQGFPIGYYSYGNNSFKLGEEESNLNVQLESIKQTTPLSATIQSGSYTLDRHMVFADFGKNQAMTLVDQRNNAGSFSYQTPVIAGMQRGVIALAHNDSGAVASYRTDIAENQNIILDFPENIPFPLFPLHDSVSVNKDATFRWQNFSQGIHQVVIIIGHDQRNPNMVYVITTDKTEIKLPDLSQEGINLPSNTSGRWFVVGMTSYQTVDAASQVTDGFLQDSFGLFAMMLGNNNYTTFLPENSGRLALSKERRFRTAP